MDGTNETATQGRRSMTHAELIARLRSRAGYVATLSTDRNLMRDAADALEAITSDEAVERGARELWSLNDGGSFESWTEQARAVLNAATGDNHE